MAHEGSKAMRMVKIEMLEGQLNRFVMFYDKTPQEWEFNDESSNFDSDGVATMAIKGMSSSSKSLFSNVNKRENTCLMAKESKHKVKIKGSSSPKYISSDDDDDDDDAPLHYGMNEKAIIKRLEKELVVQDQLLEVQEDLLE
jgi:hypothetical protein